MSKSPKPKTRRTTERLPVALTHDERATFSMNAADLIAESDRLLVALREHAKAKREKISELDRELREALEAVRTGIRMMPVDCEERETETGVRVFRLDTGEEVRPPAGTNRELFTGSDP
jgi:hypothetical protein